MTVSDEKGVKRLVAQALTKHGWKHWPIVQTAYSVGGVADRIAIRAGVFMAIETKYKYNKPSDAQKKFLRTVREEHCFAFVVNEKTIDLFEDFLDAFDLAAEAAGKHQDADDETKACLIKTVALLSQPYLED